MSGTEMRAEHSLSHGSAHFFDTISEDACHRSYFVPEYDSAVYPPDPDTYMFGRDECGFIKDPSHKFLNYYPLPVRELVKYRFTEKNIPRDSAFAYDEIKYKIECERNKNPNSIVPTTMLGGLNMINMLKKEGLQPHNHRHWFSMQLWIEEVEKENNLRYFHMQGEFLHKLEDPYFYDLIELYKLKVPGVSERKPRITTGDSIFVRHVDNGIYTWPIYEGLVHRVVGETLHIGFDETFEDEFPCGIPVDIQFWLNRTSIIRAHCALEHSHVLQHILFPKAPSGPISKLKTSIQFFDSRVGANVEQRQAVTAIVNNFSKSAPYILFGPPGTGKTSTLVEAIKQVHKLEPNSRILVSAPSNAACDLITERLLPDIPATDMLRVNAQGRAASIPQKVRAVSNIEYGIIWMPLQQDLVTYRIIISTFITAAKVVPLLMTKGEYDGKDEFTHVFLDESGQGSEAEAIIPLLGLAKHVVLTGDPCQLGPVVHSNYCRKYSALFKNAPLEQSLLERLMSSPLYSVDPLTKKYNLRLITKLLNNYRSHGSILHIPDKMFYGDQLRTRGDKSVIDCMLDWEELPNKKLPLIFHGVNGKDEREGYSHSYFNPQEVSEVIQYVQKLKKACGQFKIAAKDIGIVAPYRMQIEKLKAALQKHVGRWGHQICVGSPEQFQGDERKVILLSTVRAPASFGELLYNDAMFQLGFLRNPKRFNVSVTRAQALLVIVGNPWLLSRDVYPAG